MSLTVGQTSNFDYKKYTILLVDDNPTNLGVAVDYLEEWGLTTLISRSGQSCLERASYACPDIILLDVQMPGIDGFETCRRLKNDQLTQDIPVIFMTALSGIEDKVKGFEVGGVDYVTKPIQPQEVLARIKVHLQLRYLTKTLTEQTETLEKQNILLKEEIKQRVEAEENLNKTLRKLQAAQNQIIAQEKLASLGSLTAGIAHELRNPLNFVNNYAEGSVELTEEAIVTLENQLEHPNREGLDSVKEILTDLQENATAIHQHGQRASSIISIMMQHARTSSSSRQLTDINQLLSEAVKLVERSKQSSGEEINFSFSTDYDHSLGYLELMPSALSHAFINILDNAYYAVSVKHKNYQENHYHQDQLFTPKLWVQTKNLGEIAEVRIRDNGVGITPEIADKIFNPFFTTKPTGTGIGLGLSLTHDIIVGRHGGNLKVETEPGIYTEFIITLPKNSLALRVGKRE